MNEEQELIFSKIITGDYTYRNKDGEQEYSHALYGLDDLGRVYKFIPMKRMWLRIEEIDTN